jgi:hypothetical protein
MDIENKEPEMILGKYKTTDDLKNAYLSLKNSYDSMATERNKFTVPEQGYEVSENFKLASEEVLDSTRNKAKNMGLTQTQFENMLAKDIEKNSDAGKAVIEIKTEFGDELDSLKDYVINDLAMSDSFFNKMSKDDLLNIRILRQKSLDTGWGNPSSSNIAPPSKYTDIDKVESFNKMMNAKNSGNYKEQVYHQNRYREILSKIHAG